MTAHASTGRDGALEVNARGLPERAEVGAAQGLGRDTDGEDGGCEVCNGEAGAVDTDAVA